MDNHKNLAYSLVAVAPTPGNTGLTLEVLAGQGARFPPPPFNVTVWASGELAQPTNAEILRIVSLVGDTLTVLRAQEGTTARYIKAGDQIANTITAKVITDIEALAGGGGGGSGGGSGTIGGSIANTQVAFGTGVDTIGGSGNLRWTGSVLSVGDGGTLPTEWILALDSAINQRQYIAYDITSLSANSSGRFSNVNAGIISAITIEPVADDPDFTYAAALSGLVYVPSTSAKAIGNITGSYIAIQNDGTGNTNGGMTGNYVDLETSTEIHNMEGFIGFTTARANVVENRGGLGHARQFGGTATRLFGLNAYASVLLTGSATSAGGLYVGTLVGSNNTYFGVYVAAQEGAATNPYSFWSDEQGVYRIRSDNTFNSVYQAITALYNPQFTKYTPGAANYERIVQQWETNVAYLRTEAGGTGTLRDIGLSGANIRLDGTVIHGANYQEHTEMTAPSAGASNTVRIYAQDNGAGKTQLMALFNSGAAQQIAIEP